MNPMIQALDMGYRPIGEAVPLNEIKGMAYGVREDIEAGKTGLIGNQCVSEASRRVYWWNVL